MTERVYPADYSGEMPPPPLRPPPAGNPSGSYVVQLPKDQIYRMPPPQNARLEKIYAARASRRRRGSCFCFLRYFLCLLLLLLLAVAIAAAVFYFVYHPKLPSYALNSLSIKNLNLSAPNSAAFSPEFDGSFTASNPNSKIGIYYREGSSISVYYSGITLAGGRWPAFYQPPENVTAFVVVLKGNGVRFSAPMHNQMLGEEKNGAVPLMVDMKVPVKIKIGKFTTWKIDFKVKCDVKVDKLTAAARIVSKSCHVKKVDVF